MGGTHVLSDAVEQLAKEFHLSDAEQSELLPSGRQSRLSVIRRAILGLTQSR